jgi:hypothetical protein
MQMGSPTMKRALLPLGLLLLVFLFIRSCIPAPITDLRLVAVRRVPATALPAGNDLRPALMARAEALWKVTLEGDAGWVGEVRRHELNGYAIVVRCDQPDASLLALGPYVGETLISYYAEGMDALDPAGRATLRYDIYLPETGRYHSQADVNAPMPGYDLGGARHELCARIAAGAMTGAYNRSNLVRFSVGAAR